VAVSFHVYFDLTRLENNEHNEQMLDAALRVEGSCSYDPNLKDVSEIEIKEWSLKLPEGGLWTLTTWGGVQKWGEKTRTI
jgi:hypothetical protein